MKILIAGANGQVGSAAEEILSRDEHDVVALTRSDMDITNRDDVFIAVHQLQPDVVINAAAMTNVDACETQREQAFAANALGVRHLSQACDGVDAHLIHLSTDFVFDGQTSQPYNEYDLTHPLSVYAASKLGGETEALRGDKTTVLRVAWVFGNTQGDFFSWVANGVRDGSITSLIDDQVGTPTYSYDIVQVMQYVMSHRLYGLYHVANVGETTRREMGRVLCEELGITSELGGISAASLARPAARPNYSALSTDALTRVTGIHMRPWRDALSDHLARAFSQATS